ncbi:hypothetical protein [Prevotella histicola]|uniref:hypothetical protein n=2 Tax=Prevotella histicola TaxID=470565 RepID=UPI00356B6D9C
MLISLVINKIFAGLTNNILGITNAANPTSLTKLSKAKLGGRSSHTYEYDELNRLIHASGKTKRASCDMVMSFPSWRQGSCRFGK